MARSASLCPAFVSRSASVAPDLSSSSERVSETVSTAMLSGTKGRVSSMPGMDRAWSREDSGFLYPGMLLGSPISVCRRTRHFGAVRSKKPSLWSAYFHLDFEV